MNTGKVCIGTIGNEHRMDTTTIGDAVNLASRVASCTKMYHSPVLLSESTRNLFSGSGHIFRVLGHTQVKGRQGTVVIWESLETDSAKQQQLKQSYGELFNRAQKAFHNKDWGTAQGLIAQLLEQNPEDGPARYFKKYMDEGGVQFVK